MTSTRHLMLKSVFCVHFTGFYCLALERNYGKAQLDRHRLSATKLQARNSSFQRYITCADIRRLCCANSDKSCVLCLYSAQPDPQSRSKKNNYPMITIFQCRSRTFGRPGRWSNLPPFRLRFLKLESLFKAQVSRNVNSNISILVSTAQCTPVCWLRIQAYYVRSYVHSAVVVAILCDGFAYMQVRIDGVGCFSSFKGPATPLRLCVNLLLNKITFFCDICCFYVSVTVCGRQQLYKLLFVHLYLLFY